MAGKSPDRAPEQKLMLKTLAGGTDRGEADRARAILQTLKGWTGPKNAGACDVRGDTCGCSAATLHLIHLGRCAQGLGCALPFVILGPGRDATRWAAAFAASRGPDELDAGAAGQRAQLHLPLAALESTAEKEGATFADRVTRIKCYNGKLQLHVSLQI